MKGWLLLLVMVGLAACSEVAPTPAEELVAELRAWRRQQAALASQPGPVAVDPMAARAAIAESLQPLREILLDLSGRQRELQERQVALTQELQRWSQLLVESVQGARSDEGKAMTTRLQQLELSLREQDARHRQVEDVMQRALVRTAEQLEAFLERVGGGAPPAAGATGPGPAGAAAPREIGAAVSAGRRPGLERWSWFMLVAFATGAGWWFVQKARRQPQPPTGAMAPGRPGAPAPARLPTDPEALVGGFARPDAGAPEIWAAAALLGEAVGRLRQSHAGSAASQPAAGTATPLKPGMNAGPTVAEAAPVPADGEADEEFVIDDLGGSEPASGPAAPIRQGPPLVRCRLVGADAARAVAALPRVFATEPAVLQRPAPMIEATTDGVEVSFALLPGTPAGERSRIEQQLREALH